MKCNSAAVVHFSICGILWGYCPIELPFFHYSLGFSSNSDQGLSLQTLSVMF